MEAVGIRLFLPRLLLELGRLTSSSCPQTGVYTIGSPSFSGLGIRTALPHWLSGTGCRRQITVPLSHQGHVIQFLTINLLVCPYLIRTRHPSHVRSPSLDRSKSTSSYLCCAPGVGRKPSGWRDAEGAGERHLDRSEMSRLRQTDGAGDVCFPQRSST